MAVESVVVGDCPLDETVGRPAGGRARGDGQRRPGRGRRPCRSSSRWSRPGCRSSSATGGRASTRRRWPTDRRGISDSIAARMARHGGRRTSAAPPGGHGGRIGHAPDGRSHDHDGRPDPAGLPGRRPPPVPGRRPRRARPRRRGGGGGRRGGGGHRAHRRAGPRRGPGRRPHARWRGQAVIEAVAASIPTSGSWPCRCPTRPRTSSG